MYYYLGMIEELPAATVASNVVPHSPWAQIGPLLAQKRKVLRWVPFFDPRHRYHRAQRVIKAFLVSRQAD